MSPPIRDGSGSSIGSIRLGDGSEISEVRTGAGDVLFSAIPDSVIAQFQGSSYTAGDTTWTDKASSAGSQDATLTDNGLSETTASDGSAAIKSGGSSFGQFTPPSELEGSSLTSFSIELALQYSANETFNRVTGATTGNTQSVAVFMDVDEGNNTDNGNINFEVTDQDGNLVRAAPTTNPNLDDGKRHDITLNAVDTTTNDLEIIIDGSSVSLSFSFTGNPDNFTTWGNDWYLFAGENNKNPKTGKYIAYRLHDTSTNQTIDEI